MHTIYHDEETKHVASGTDNVTDITKSIGMYVQHCPKARVVIFYKGQWLRIKNVGQVENDATGEIRVSIEVTEDA